MVTGCGLSLLSWGSTQGQGQWRGERKVCAHPDQMQPLPRARDTPFLPGWSFTVHPVA